MSREHVKPSQLRSAPSVGHALGELASADPDQPFFKLGQGSWQTYADLDEASDELAAGLARAGVVHGDRVALVCESRLEAVDVLFACSKLGAILVPLNYHLRGEFLRYQLLDSEPKLLMVDGPGARSAAPLLDELDLSGVFLLDEDDGSVPGASPLQDLRLPGEHPPDVEIKPHDLMSILYTSGTTGLPKGCMLSHGYYLAAGWAAGPMGWVLPNDVMFVGFPHFHTSFQLNSLMSALVNGASLVLEPEFRASTFMKRASAEGATMVWGLGPMAMAILAQPPSEGERPAGLRMSAWVPLHPDQQKAMEERFGGVVNCEAYAQTEVNPIVMTPPDSPNRDRSTAGFPGPLYEVAVVDSMDEQLSAGSVGEIVVRPHHPTSMFSGYWRKHEATAQTFRNLWHHTGDLGVFDEQGRLTFMDRAKDAVRRRGENVSCFELEMAIGQHPEVEQVAVTAVPSPLGEDDIKVSIVPVEGSEVTAEGIFPYLRDNLPYYAVPRYLDIRSEMPTTATGRVRKDALRSEGLSEDIADMEELGLVVERGARRG